MDFEPCFKVYNLVSIRPKSLKLGQMINLNVIFHMMGSVYRLVTIRNSPQFPVEFRNGLLIMAGMSSIKEVHGKPKLYVSANPFFGVWPPCCATPSSCVRAHEQYH